ncbi:hypothetical protein PFISCL1PPCAC_2213, partial [Pristionchus fissidentatus]
PPPPAGYPPPPLPKQGNDNCLIFCLIWILPPLAVYYKDNKTCSAHVWINVLLYLTFFGGVFHALWFCFCRN